MRGGDHSHRPGARQKMLAGTVRGLAEKRAYKRAAIAEAIEWRESRRCTVCGALAYVPCVHRPNGAHGEPADLTSAVQHMPFAGHRTCAEWMGKAATLAKLGGDGAAVGGQRPPQIDVIARRHGECL